MSVLLGYLHGAEISASFQASLQALIAWDAAHGRHLRQYAALKCSTDGIVAGRNSLAKALLESDCEWVFMVDSDMGFDADALDRLMAVAHPSERPIVGGLCFAYKEIGPDGKGGFHCLPVPTIFDWVQHPDGHHRMTSRSHYPVNQLVRCAATGAAFVLIHRSVFAKIADEYGPVWFDRIRGTDGDVFGEDISFFVRCGATEIPVHVHTGVRTTHQKTIWLSEDHFWRDWVAPPATDPVTVIVPTVADRVGNIERLATSLRASTGLAEALFVVDDEDHAAAVKEWGRTVIQPGRFPVKVNAGYRHTDTPWILVVGDDVVFRPGWLDHAQHVAKAYHAEVVATNDLANPRVMAGEHATHPMISRHYIEEEGASWDGPGVVCHEGYRHWFCDDEIVAKARQRGVFQAALGAIVEHYHPISGKADMDEVYERNDRYASQDRDLFRKRLAANS